MEFHVEALIPQPARQIWSVLVDIARIAACIPGCEDVVEQSRLEQYSAVLKQKLGPFKLTLPAQIHVDEALEPQRLRAHASGRDKMTGTQITVALTVTLNEQPNAQTLLVVDADMQVNGKLASLGYPVIKKKTEENFDEFRRRLLAQLGVAGTDTDSSNPAD